MIAICIRNVYFNYRIHFAFTNLPALINSIIISDLFYFIELKGAIDNRNVSLYMSPFHLKKIIYRYYI